MELAHRARDLEQLLRPASSSTSAGKRKDLLATVREEVDVEVRGLRVRIIEGLRSRGLKLPAAVRSVALLRKMTQSSQEASSTSVERKSSVGEASSLSGASSSLSEPELRLTFLTSRWDCLRSQLDQLEVSASASGDSGSTEDHVRYLKRWLEVWREVIGETVNIYSEIFLSQATVSALSPSPSPSLAAGSQSADYLSQQLLPDGSDSAIASDILSQLHLLQPHPPLSIFLGQCLQSLRHLLTSQLPRVTAVSALASLQTQISY